MKHHGSYFQIIVFLNDQAIGQDAVSIQRQSFQACDSHNKDKTIPTPSYLYHEKPNAGKTISFYWNRPKVATWRRGQEMQIFVTCFCNDPDKNCCIYIRFTDEIGHKQNILLFV